MYFLRVDYIYKHSGVQRTRDLCESLSQCLRILKSLRGENTKILQIKIEFIV